MPITKDSGRQRILSAEVVVNLADVVSGVAAPAVDLPFGARVTGGDVVVDTAFNAGTAATLNVGDATTPNRYLNAQSIAATGRTALTITGFKTTLAEPTVNVTPTFTGTPPTTGKLRLSVHYVVDGRADENQD